MNENGPSIKANNLMAGHKKTKNKPKEEINILFRMHLRLDYIIKYQT